MKQLLMFGLMLILVLGCGEDSTKPPPPESKLTQLTTDPGHDWFPQWSPDGGKIAFMSDRDGYFGIWVIPATGGEAVQLTTDPADDVEPQWSPDGSKIAFMSSRSGNTDIWVIRVD